MKNEPETRDAAVTPTPASAGEVSLWELIDRESTLRRLGNDEALFWQLVDFFLEDHPPLMEKIGTAITQNDASAMERAAHSLKGLTANLGATEVTRWAAELETNGRNRDLSQAAALSQGLTMDLACLVQALKHHRSNPAKP